MHTAVAVVLQQVLVHLHSTDYAILCYGQNMLCVMSLPSRSLLPDSVLLCSTHSSDQETDNCEHEEHLQPTHARTYARTHSPTGQTKTLFVNLKLP
jgi:hypothetical protein